MRSNKKNTKTFTQRKTNKERSKRELLKIAEQIGIGTSAAKVKFTYEESSGRERRTYTAEGMFSEAQGGFGFVSVEGRERDIFIPESGVGEAVDGDRVLVTYKKYLSQDGEERTEGRIKEITEIGRSTVIGTVEEDTVRFHKRRIRTLYLLPDDGKLKRRIEIRDAGGAKDGEKVMAKLIRGSSFYNLTCDVLSSFGPADTKDANYLSILAECGIDTEFTGNELALAQAASEETVTCEDRIAPDGVIFTIDSESAKDLDDAISIKKLKNGLLELSVHIADVSHYVKEKTALDRLVMQRGTSVYFTDKVVPMLPPSLSNGACSLHPGEDKYALSVSMTFDRSGEMLSSRIEKTVIRSTVKGVYSEINKIIKGTKSKKLLEKYAECLPSIKLMHKLYLCLLAKSERRGYVELDSPEAEIILDKNGEPIDIVRRERGDAERMVEQFMLAANEAVATTLIEGGIPCVYRIHEEPPADKLESFITYAHNLGFDTSYINANACSPSDLARLLKEAQERGLSEPVSYACLRSMAKATYSEINQGHFGLGIKNYCHFTSPIRRLSDLATHRIIHAVLFDGKSREKYRSYAKRAAAAATEGELRAVSAERRIENLYKTIYMNAHIGEVFAARVSGVSSFGIFAVLENTCEGLIPISTMGGGFVFDESNLTLRDSKVVIRVGDAIRIRVEEADMCRGKLRFSLEGGYNEGKN